eukprot:scaffold256935_cov38-Prasinocladus_malaysianus.AAC.1
MRLRKSMIDVHLDAVNPWLTQLWVEAPAVQEAGARDYHKLTPLLSGENNRGSSEPDRPSWAPPRRVDPVV